MDSVENLSQFLPSLRYGRNCSAATGLAQLWMTTRDDIPVGEQKILDFLSRARFRSATVPLSPAQMKSGKRSRKKVAA